MAHPLPTVFIPEPVQNFAGTVLAFAAIGFGYALIVLPPVRRRYMGWLASL